VEFARLTVGIASTSKLYSVKPTNRQCNGISSEP